MKKTCAFCGKELLDDNKQMHFGTKSIACCSACVQAYELSVALEGVRFGIKLENVIKKAKTMPTDSEIAAMFIKYLSEKNYYREKQSKQKFNNLLNSLSYTNEGYFTVEEFGKEFANSNKYDDSKTAQIYTMCGAFDKNDVTKIEYALEDTGDFTGVFQKRYSFSIRLNDETVMTYKPCLAKAASCGYGFGFGYERSAEKRLVKLLDQFKKQIGLNLPIVKVASI